MWPVVVMVVVPWYQHLHMPVRHGQFQDKIGKKTIIRGYIPKGYFNCILLDRIKNS